MECVSVDNVTFSQDSLDAIEDLRRRLKAISFLSKAIPSGAMAIIFLGNKSLHSAYNITQHDFQTMAKAMQALPAIKRRIIKDTAQIQQLYSSGNEAKFWRGIYYGCSI